MNKSDQSITITSVVKEKFHATLVLIKQVFLLSIGIILNTQDKEHTICV